LIYIYHVLGDRLQSITDLLTSRISMGLVTIEKDRSEFSTVSVWWILDDRNEVFLSREKQQAREVSFPEPSIRGNCKVPEQIVTVVFNSWNRMGVVRRVLGLFFLTAEAHY
jgi:hypothetical protein